jgi:hypothetical protein
MIRDHRCVELIEYVSFDYSYALFGVLVIKIYISEVLKKSHLATVPVREQYPKEFFSVSFPLLMVDLL